MAEKKRRARANTPITGDGAAESTSTARTTADVAQRQELGPLRQLGLVWRMTMGRAFILLASALGFAVLLGGLVVARQGLPNARMGGGIVAALGLLLPFGARLLVRRFVAQPERVLRRLARPFDAEAADRALRALPLLAMADGTSQELASLHLARVLQKLPLPAVESQSRRRSRFVRWMAAVTTILVCLGIASEPFAVLESIDVLFARKGEGAFAIDWLEGVSLKSRPPDYLHENEKEVTPFAEDSLPNGSLLTVRGTPLHKGRKLLLSNGKSEVPFVDDGQGGVVARWPLNESAALRVVVRFGGVFIPDSRTLKITDIPDAAPIVKLEGAPRTMRLAAEDASEIPIRYTATDDHGLREVQLVLRAGVREDRRVLSRLDGATMVDRGGHNIRPSDSFFKKSHVPIEVRVEAKDNDPLTGPKWGASEAITVIPPDVGEPEAMRLDALRRLRDAFVDSLAVRIETPVPTPSEAAARKTRVVEEQRRAEDDSARVEQTLAATYAGARVPARLGAMLRGQMKKLKEALDAYAGASASKDSSDKLTKATERVVLVIDGMIRGLGFRGSRDTALELADTADDLVLGYSQRLRGEVPRGTARTQAATVVLHGGAKSLFRMGSLGRDLGEIVENDLSRVARAETAGDLTHAELAARDLAARLREPDPSFGAKGSSRGGGESGGSTGGESESDSQDGESSAEQAFNEAARNLDELARDHAGEISKVEQAMGGDGTDDDVKSIAEEAKKHAQAIRDAAGKLPSVGAGSDSWTSKGSAAKELSEQMARSLEQGNPSDAVQSGKSAMNALEEARRVAQRERSGLFGGENEAEKRLEAARKGLEPEIKWAEEKLAELRKRAASRAQNQLGTAGDEEEKLAERAGKLGEQGRDKGGLPGAALESLNRAEKSARDAARALKRGEGDKALEAQRDAQRALEMAKEALGSESEGEKSGERGEGRGELGNQGDLANHADIPKADSHKGPEEFRRRVMKGLGTPGGRQENAVKRYAEGLLR